MDLELCKTKKFVELRDDFCLKSYTNIEEQNLCISNSKESLGIETTETDSEKPIETEACWDVKVVLNDNTISLIDAELFIQEDYTKQIEAECIDSDD